MFEIFAKTECIYKGREGWYFTYTKLLWVKFGDRHFMNDFGGVNLNADTSWRTLYNKILLVKEFEATSNGTVV